MCAAHRALPVGALASMSAGYCLAGFAADARRLPTIFGVLLLIAFLPVHQTLWDKFPIWYHLLFLSTIVPFVAVGALLGARQPSTMQSRQS